MKLSDMKSIFVDLYWDEKKGKKVADFHKKPWGKLKKGNTKGYLTGDGVTVIDIDSKETAKIDKKLMKLLKKFKPNVVTSKGMHYYFTCKDMKTIKEVLPKVDIRSKGGLVFYEYNGDDDRISYKVVREDIPKMPKKLYKYLIKLQGGEKPVSQTGVSEFERIEAPVYEWSEEDVAEMLTFIDGYDDYDTWIKVGMALYSWSEGDEVGYRLYDEWSKQSEKYDGVYNKWRSFRADGEITIGTIVYMAKENGYKVRELREEDIRIYKARREKYKEILYKFNHELLDTDAILAYIDNSAWQVDKQRVVWVSRDGNIRDVVRGDVHTIWKHIKAPMSRKKRERLEANIIADTLGDKLGTPKQQEKVIRDFYSGVYSSMVEFLIKDRQYNILQYTVDPWKKTPGIEMEHYTKTAIITHTRVVPKPPKKVEDEKIVSDYKEHFPMLDEFISVLAAMRFGGDRKIAYIWFRATSNWGKSMLFGNLLKSLGIIVNIKESELKKAIKGDPVGMHPEEFVFAWALVFEEFKGAVSEIKDITHSIQMAPKNKGRVEVPVYGKIFLSAEQVKSLKNDNGVEAQFANRFSLLDLEGDITKRPLYMKNQERYKDVLRWYIYERIMEEVKIYTSYSKEEAAVKANHILMAFRDKFKIISDDAETLESKVQRDFRDWLITKFDDQFIDNTHFITTPTGQKWVRNKGKTVEMFLTEYYSKQEAANLWHKSNHDIMGKYVAKKYSSVKIKGKVISAYKVLIDI